MQRWTWVILLLATAGCEKLAVKSLEPFQAIEPDPGYREGRSWDNLATAHRLPERHLGLFLYDAERREVLVSHQSDRPFLPASTLKIVTALAALENLGPGFRFSTELGMRGRVRRGVLRGDLVLRGGGDPLFLWNDMVLLVEKLRRKKIRRVRGRFLIDDYLFPSYDRIDQKGNLNERYNPGVSPLSLNFNQFSVLWRRDGSKALYNLIPPSQPARIRLGDRPSASGETFYWERQSWLFSPESPRRGKRKLPVRYPSKHFAAVFRDLAAQQGITLPMPRPGRWKRGVQRIHRHQSQPVGSLVRSMLEYSNNLIAELIFLRTAKKMNRRVRNRKQAARTVQVWLKKRVRVRNWDPLKIVNGSGLSVRNRITPEQLTRVLVFGDSRQYAGRPLSYFMNLMGQANKNDDDLSDRFTALRVSAKRGGLDYVYSLVGVLRSQKHRRLFFSIMVSDFEKRETLNGGPDTPGFSRIWGARGGWHNRARDFAHQLLNRWITSH